MNLSRIAALVALVGACGPHEDFTPLIHVAPNAAKRIDWLHGVTDAHATTHASARVHVMKTGEELGGPNAIGRSGDVLLENDEVAFVIDQIGDGDSAGFAESGGNIVDAADAHVRKDELGQVFAYFGTFPRQAIYTSIASGVLQDGIAFVEARGRELRESSLVVRTRYTLHPSDRALLIETTLDNTSDHMLALPGLGDAVQWGGSEKFSPDRGKGFKGSSNGAFLAGVGRFASYAITSTDGAIAADSGPTWSDTLQQRRTEIPAGKSVAYARVFVVGPRADVAGLVSELTKTAGGAVGSLRVQLLGDTGAVAPSSDATLEIGDAKGNAIMDMRVDRAGALVSEVPPGKYTVRYLRGGGRGARGVPQAIEVLPGHESPATVGVTASGRLHAQCMERLGSGATDAPTPCKATVEGIGNDSPTFGPAGAAGAAKNQFTTSDGHIEVSIAPGKYRVTLSRGPEYALATFEVEVKPGDNVDGCEVAERCILRHVVDTSGWIACDFHQHTMLGVDAPVSTRDRVIANVAEGVELAVVSEHNAIAELEPVVRAMGLASSVVELPGNEVTSDWKPWGHVTAFPLVVHPELPRGGAVHVRDRGAKDVLAEIRARDPSALIQINHPRSGTSGYFDLLGFDRATGTSTNPDWDPRFDAIELWNGRNAAARATVLTDALALIRTSHPVTITGNSDTHGVVGQEPGFPRTYVKVSNDRDLDTWTDARTVDLVRSLRETRQVLVTNGPFLRVRVDGADSIGRVLRVAGKVAVTVSVASAPWIEVKHVQIVRALGPKAPSTERIEADVRPHPTASGALEALTTFTLAADRDDAFFVIATGDRPLTPVLAGDITEIRPYAISGAIWLDADGDGHSLGR